MAFNLAMSIQGINLFLTGFHCISSLSTNIFIVWKKLVSDSLGWGNLIPLLSPIKTSALMQNS